MTSADDFGLTRLFLPRPVGTGARSPLGGTMTAWDPITGNNTVVIGSTTYTNLPVVSPNGLTLGPVLVQKTSAGWMVMGMVSNAGQASLVDPLRYRELPTDLSLVSSTFVDAGVLNFLMKPATKYALDGIIFYVAASAADLQLAWSGPPNMVTPRWGLYGVTTGTLGTSGNVETWAIAGYGDANPQPVGGAGATFQHCRPMGRFQTTDTGGILQLRAAQATTNATPTVIHAGSWLRLAELSLAGGATTYLKQYVCTASRSYDSAGNPIGATDQDNNVYQGEFPDRAFGNERSMMIFPGSTIRADLTGATPLSARLYLYCFKAEETYGSCIEPRVEPNTSVPATYAPVDTSPNTSRHDAWVVNTWNSVECLVAGGSVSLLNGILAGGNAIGLPPTLFGLGATGFRGFGFSATYRPYLEVAYAI